MPGPVHAVHADIENDCAACHSPSDEQTQAELCNTCHVEVGSDIAAGLGYHGKHPAARLDDCQSCHTDHEGRDAQLTEPLLLPFDHGLTDFPLVGAHQAAECATCHAADEPKWTAPTECGGCHADDDPHMGELGADCETCHTQVTWLPTIFDHADTGFRLHGAHAVLECASCHEDQTFNDAQSSCVSCHADDDPHMGELGTACQTCHTDVDWLPKLFDHASTGFPLIGGHAALECVSCHEDQTFTGASSECVTCHAEDDAHDGSFGTQCATCHSVDDWMSATFDHTTTGFLLDGAHATASCESCHAPGVLASAAEPACVSCHKEDDVHQGRNGDECASCHNTTDWAALSFDHVAVSGFTLLGKHAVLACESCHTGALTDPLPRTCAGCHSDDPHDGQLGSDCEQCHNNLSWVEPLRFDHTFSRFPLLGGHAELVCKDCHRDLRFLDADPACVSCHAEDDPHNGAFGLECQGCHNEASWDGVAFDHQAETGFELVEAHAVLACESCHRTAEPLTASSPDDCQSCHSADDPHGGEFGGECGSCHSATAFTPIRGF
ncbi:MAG: cytochrome c3 family protein [Pseudomonadota bacterium]